MSRPGRVGVVIPVFNLRAYVGEAIESVLGQTVPARDVDLVVVDDGSTDGSGDLAAARSPRVRVVRQANRGLPAARNAGVAATDAELLVFLDADDVLLPDHLAATRDALAARPDAGIAYAGWRYVDADGTVLPQGYPRDEGDLLPRLVLGNVVVVHAAMVRRATFEDAGGFDESLTSVEDWDLWLRASRRGARWVAVDRVLAEYRLRPDAMHRDPGRMLVNRLRVLDKTFADPGLPPDVRALRARAYQNVDLTAACDYYRVGDRNRGVQALRAALVRDPTLIADVRGIRRLQRCLLPIGHQAEAEVLARGAELDGLVARMLGDVFALRDLEPAIAAFRWRARVAIWRARARHLRKRALRRASGFA